MFSEDELNLLLRGLKEIRISDGRAEPPIKPLSWHLGLDRKLQGLKSLLRDGENPEEFMFCDAHGYVRPSLVAALSPDDCFVCPECNTIRQWDYLADIHDDLGEDIG